AEVYLQSTALGPDGGMVFVCVGVAGGAELGMSACLSAPAVLNQWITLSGIPMNGDASAATTVSVGIQTGDAWTGTVYVAHVSVN
ncbi:MAG: hypothetical protein ABSC94_33170, partial [Polyangiaceae bacterium]